MKVMLGKRLEGVWGYPTTYRGAIKGGKAKGVAELDGVLNRIFCCHVKAWGEQDELLSRSHFYQQNSLFTIGGKGVETSRSSVKCSVDMKPKQRICGRKEDIVGDCTE